VVQPRLRVAGHVGRRDIYMIRLFIFFGEPVLGGCLATPRFQLRLVLLPFFFLGSGAHRFLGEMAGGAVAAVFFEKKLAIGVV